MRCKCGEELSDRAMARGGDYQCDLCHTVSEEVLYEYQNADALRAEVPAVDKSEAALQALFGRLVAKHDLLGRWCEGLEEDRIYLLQALNREQQCYQDFMALVEDGMQPQVAAEWALGIIPTPAR